MPTNFKFKSKELSSKPKTKTTLRAIKYNNLQKQQ